MNKLYTAASILALAICLPAQGTLPPGYLTTESSGSDRGHWAFYMGGYAASRHQAAYGDLKGKGVIFMNEISFRQDTSRGTGATTTAVARTWTNLTVYAADTNIATLSSMWTKNHLSTPTLVYSAKHSWPDMTSNPGGNPNPWNNGGLKIPFTTTYLYSSAYDILFDFEFAGGTLANNATWGTSTRKTVYLDGRSNYTSQQGSLAVYGFNYPCTFDSGNVSTSSLGGGYGYFIVYSYNTPSNRFGYRTYYTNMPKSTPFVQGLSLKGTTSTTTPGPIPGLGCQALQIDLSQMFLTQMFTTPSSGTYSGPTQYTAFVSAAVGIYLWSQGIWNDTVTNNPKLTRTGRCVVPVLPRKPDFSGKRLYRSATGTPPTIPSTGSGPYETYVEIIRYK